MLPVVWLRRATTEYYDSLQWYAEIGPQLAERFAQAVGDAVQVISDSPLRFPVIHKNRRRAGVRRFPYGLFFLIEPSRIVIVACFHGKRNPRHWQRR